MTRAQALVDARAALAAARARRPSAPVRPASPPVPEPRPAAELAGCAAARTVVGSVLGAGTTT